MISRTVLLCSAALLAAACTKANPQSSEVRSPPELAHQPVLTESAASAASLASAETSAEEPAPPEAPKGIRALFISAPTAKIVGEATLTSVSEGVRIHIEVHGSSPGPKGIHIHQTTDCSDIPKKSMGGHFSPEVTHHGLPDARHHHLGDLGNIEIDREGKGVLDIVVANANLTAGDPLSFLSRSVVLHGGTDNGKGESGESGPPVACAPINP